MNKAIREKPIKDPVTKKNWQYEIGQQREARQFGKGSEKRAWYKVVQIKHSSFEKPLLILMMTNPDDYI